MGGLSASMSLPHLFGVKRRNQSLIWTWVAFSNNTLPRDPCSARDVGIGQHGKVQLLEEPGGYVSDQFLLVFDPRKRRSFP